MRRKATSAPRRRRGEAGKTGDLAAGADLFRVLADPLRLRLLLLLAGERETCVCRLVEAVGEPQYKVSRHLAVMRAAGIVEYRRAGTWRYYRLAPPASRLAKRLPVPWQALLLSISVYVALPLGAGYVTRRAIVGWKGEAWFREKFLHLLTPITITALLVTLVLLFSFKGDVILSKSPPRRCSSASPPAPRWRRWSAC